MPKTKPVKQEMDLVKLIEQFRSEDECRAFLEEIRWPNGPECPRCQSKSISKIKTRNQLDCNTCRFRFSVKSGTIFHDSHLALWKWMLATYLMVESKKGVSANQIKRTLGVSYKTAWYLCHRIRAAMTEMNAEKLGGTVEVDETYVGGKVKGKGRRYTGNKAIVVGIVQRGGKVRLKVIEHANRKTLHKFIMDHSDDETEAIYTDEWPAYRGIADSNTRHETVNHNQEEWVRGDVHTNTIENVWTLLKRSVTGTFHKISVKHLDAYLDELEWRFNNRQNPWLFRDTVNKMVGAERLEFKDLVKD